MSGWIITVFGVPFILNAGCVALGVSIALAAKADDRPRLWVSVVLLILLLIPTALVDWVIYAFLSGQAHFS